MTYSIIFDDSMNMSRNANNRGPNIIFIMICIITIITIVIFFVQKVRMTKNSPSVS